MEGNLDSPPARWTTMWCGCQRKRAAKELVDRGENFRGIGRLGPDGGRIVADRFEVRDDPHQPRHAGPHVILERRGLAMGLLQRERLGHFQVQFQPTLRVLVVKADGMGPRPRRAARMRTCVVMSWSARASGSAWTTTSAPGTTVRTASAASSAISWARSKLIVWPTESVMSAKTSDPARRMRTLVTASTPLHLPGGVRHLVAQIVGDAVQEVVDRLLAQFQADPDHDSGHAQGGDRVGVGQPRQIEGLRRQHAQQSQKHDARRPDIGREVQGIGLQGLAVVFLRYPQQGPRAREVDDDREQRRPGTPTGWDRLQSAAWKNSRRDGLVDDPEAGDQQEQRFEQGREVLELAVAVGYCWLVGRAETWTAQSVTPAASRSRPEWAASARMPKLWVPEPDDQFQGRQHDRCQQRGKGHPALLAVFLLAIRGMLAPSMFAARS